jgi:hypothetical protein
MPLASLLTREVPSIRPAADLEVTNIRGCANRSRSATRASLPTVATPGFSDEPPHNDQRLRESDPEVDDSPFLLSTPHQLLMGIAPRVGSFHHPTFCASKRSRLAFLLGNACQPTLLKKFSAHFFRVVGAIEVDAGMLRQLGVGLHSLEGGCQKWRVVAVCPSGHHSERNALRVHRHRTFEAPFSSIYWAFCRLLSSTRSLGDAATDGYIQEIETDGSVVSLAHHIFQSFHHYGFDPLVAPAAQRSSRARPVDDSPIGAAEDQHLHQLLEDYLVGYAGLVAAEQMIYFSFGQQVAELLENGLDYVRWNSGWYALSHREASTTVRMIEPPVLALQVGALPP